MGLRRSHHIPYLPEHQQYGIQDSEDFFHEGDIQEGEQDCAWPLCKSRRPTWEQGEDCRGLDQDLSDAQQAWQDRVEEGKRPREESLCTLKDWVTSVQAARKALQFSGFVPINGKTHQGKALYAKSKALLAERKA